MSMLRALLAICLSLALVGTSHSLIMAHSQGAGLGPVEICTDAGTVVVYLDEDGMPVTPSHDCPDCTLHLVVGVLPVQASAAPMVHARRAEHNLTGHRVGKTRPRSAQARGPPIPV